MHQRTLNLRQLLLLPVHPAADPSAAKPGANSNSAAPESSAAKPAASAAKPGAISNSAATAIASAGALPICVSLPLALRE